MWCVCVWGGVNTADSQISIDDSLTHSLFLWYREETFCALTKHSTRPCGQTEKQADRETEREKQADRETETQRERQADRERETSRQRDRDREREASRQRDRETDRQRDKEYFHLNKGYIFPQLSDFIINGHNCSNTLKET